MSKYYGGKQASMRDTVVQSAGPYQHQRVLAVGNTQRMNFGEGDEGPFWMMPEERLEKKGDRPTGLKKKRKYRKRELAEHLKEKKGINVSGTLKQIQEIATRNNLPLELEFDEIEEGWNGKPKGMLQVLWERGYIDESKSKGWWYTVNGR